MPYIIRKFEKENPIRIFMPFMVGLSLLYRLTPTWVRSQPIIGKTSYPVYALMAVTAIIITIRKFRYDDFYLWLVLFLGFRVFTTLINGQEIGWVVLSSVMCYSLVVILCYSFVVNRSGTLKLITFLMLAIIILNAINILQRHGVVPGDWFQGEFIENHNTYVLYFVILIFSLYISSIEREKSGAFCWTILLVVALITYWYERSVTSILGLLLCGACIAIPNNSWKMITIFLMVVVTCTIATCYFVVGNQMWNDVLIDLLQKMGKDPTLTNRTIIWSNYCDLIRQEPIIGHGVLRGKALQQVFYLRPTTREYTSAHNYYLNQIFQTGLIGLSFFGGALLSIIRRVKKSFDGKVLLAFIAVLFLMSQFEAYSIELYLIVMGLSFAFLVNKGDNRKYE